MPTINTLITGAWTKIAESSNSDLLVSWENTGVLEVATTTADVAPTVRGHKLDRDSAFTRSLIGPGFVWAKTAAGAKPSSVLLVVSK